MALMSLNRLGYLRLLAIGTRHLWLYLRSGIELGPGVNLSLSSKLLTRQRGCIVIGADSLVAFKSIIVTHDHRTGRDLPVRIGERCFIGGGSMILPGVTIGDECIIGAGSVVFEDVPDRSIAVGNPARVLRGEIEVGRFGRLKSADER